MKDRTVDEIVAEMHKEAKSKDLFNGEEVGEPLIRGTRIEAWADSLDAATGRERENLMGRIKYLEAVNERLIKEDMNRLAEHCLSCARTINGNAAAMREALVAIRKALLLDSGMGPHTAFHAEVDMLTAAALSAPPRNCDRFETEYDAHSAFCAEPCKHPCGNCTVTNVEMTHECFIHWLFAPAEGGAE